MNKNDRVLLISIENPKLDISLSIRFSFLGVTGEKTRWGRVEERLGYQREEILPPLSS